MKARTINLFSGLALLGVFLVPTTVNAAAVTPDPIKYEYTTKDLNHESTDKSVSNIGKSGSLKSLGPSNAWFVEITNFGNRIFGTARHLTDLHGGEGLGQLFTFDFAEGDWGDKNASLAHGGHVDIFSAGITFLTSPGDLSGGYRINVNGVHTTPLPAAVWLFGSGLMGLVGMKKKKANAEAEALAA